MHKYADYGVLLYYIVGDACDRDTARPTRKKSKMRSFTIRLTAAKVKLCA